jgi:hypothetical protein
MSQIIIFKISFIERGVTYGRREGGRSVSFGSYAEFSFVAGRRKITAQRGR